ncbi:ABC transporter permease [Streptomyces sp. NPDC012600]|uniref:ABC transporter permease n=1 Tax=Streptomyces sp. NPDC012600 TaxID=3415005 RepID=UPI003C2FCDCA
MRPPGRGARRAGRRRGGHRRTDRADVSRFALRDLLSEAVAGVLQRPARSVLTALGTVLGIGSFVAVLGLTATTSSQIDGRFNALTATEVTVEDIGAADGSAIGVSFPDDAADRIERLNGVSDAGVYWPVSLPDGAGVRASPVGATVGEEETQVAAAGPGVLRAAQPTLVAGRLFDEYHEKEAVPVAVVGSGMAARLGITTLESRPVVFIGDRPFTVIGIIGDVRRKTDLLLSVVVPGSVAAREWGEPGAESPARMLISTELGAATQIADQAPLALDPAHPERFKAVPPPDPKALRDTVGSDLNQLFLLLAVVCLVIGAVGIANTTLVAVLERTGEIGLRRTLGARAGHITSQFLAESAALGTVGGLVGTALGALTVVAVAVAREWTPVVHPTTLLAAPLIGLVTGLLAGAYPAWRASRIEPAEALRR